MNNIQFNCSDCVFAILDSTDRQRGCSLARLDKFNATLDEDSDRFQFDRFCNAYRPPEWGLIYKDIGMENIVKSEIKPRVTYIIDFDYDIKKLYETINVINGNIGSVIVVNDKVEYNQEIMNALGELKGQKYYLVQTLCELNNDEKFRISFKHAKNGWCVFIAKGDHLPQFFYTVLDDRINYKLKRLSFAQSPTGSFLIQSSLYKFVCDNIDGPGGLFEKLEKLQSDDADSIPTWGELFNDR
jgi:hypothetical protein